jgi:hypothetical protein
MYSTAIKLSLIVREEHRVGVSEKKNPTVNFLSKKYNLESEGSLKQGT